MKSGPGRAIVRGSRPNGTLARALPPFLPTVGYAAAFGLAAGLCALTGVMMGGWETPAKIRTIFLLYSAGGALAFPSGIVLARILAHGARGETAFAAAFVALTLTTLAMTAGLFGLQYRVYYAQWHVEALTWIWFKQLLYTMAAAAYQFGVLGLRLYFPFGFIALLAASLWFARQPR